MSDSHDYETAMAVVLEALFNEYERLTLWNAAYRHAIEVGGDPTEIRTEAGLFAARDQYPLGIEKYSDLRRRAIRAVQDRNPDEFAELVPQVKARIAAWGGIPEEQAQ
jgi:hypothetical protein